MERDLAFFVVFDCFFQEVIIGLAIAGSGVERLILPGRNGENFERNIVVDTRVHDLHDDIYFHSVVLNL